MKRPVTNPCTSEKLYTENEEEFLRAVQAYKERYKVKFPSLSELFYVMRQLGYRKIAEKEEI